MPRRWPSAGGPLRCPDSTRRKQKGETWSVILRGEQSLAGCPADTATAARGASFLGWAAPAPATGKREGWQAERAARGDKSTAACGHRQLPGTATQLLTLKQAALGRGVAFGGRGWWGRGSGGQRANVCPRKLVSGPRSGLLGRASTQA